MAMSTSTAGRGRNKAMTEINVTPLVDVMLVLLIIFMVTAPMMQQGLNVDLPETTNSGVPTADDPFILVISKDGRISVGDTVLPTANLSDKLKAIVSSRKNKQIYIQADKKTEYGVVAEVLAESRAAGIEAVNLITLPKTK